MHNLHLCVVRAANAEDAEDAVESALEDWGDENNWYTICGSVSEDDVVHTTDEGRYCPDELNSIVGINEWFRRLVGSPHIGVFDNDDSQAIFDTLRKLLNRETMHDWLPLYRLRQYIQHLEAAAYADLTKPDIVLNVLEHEFKCWDLAEVGVTHINEPNAHANKDNGKLFVVFVDMHS